MALLTISGEPASRWEEVANAAAQLLNFELITEARLEQWKREEFGDVEIPDRAWRATVVSIAARLAMEHHLVIAVPDAESLFEPMPMLLRAGVVASEARRIGNVMLDRRVERAEARKILNEMDARARSIQRARFGRTKESFDLILRADSLEPPQMAEILRAAVCVRGLMDEGLLSAAAEAQIQFQMRLQLSKHGIVPAGRASIKRVEFGHPSEEWFANLLDFYRIQWQYEPRSFPLQWDKDGNVTEAFTPDFYLPDFDQYIELTTMKQANVTKKNRKIKLLRAIYPHINIQVFYQKDFQDLVSKYGPARD